MNRAEYTAAIQELNERPPGADRPNQKFKRGSRVHVCENMPSYMRHFESDFDAIVDHTYAQQFGGSDIDSYNLIMLDDDGTPINSLAWYREDQLTLISDDIKAGLEIIELYRYGD